MIGSLLCGEWVYATFDDASAPIRGFEPVWSPLMPRMSVRNIGETGGGVRCVADRAPNRFRQWGDAGVFEALLEGLIAEAAKRGEVDLSLVSVDSTTVRAHYDAAGMHLDPDTLTALEEAAAEGEKARKKGATRKDKTEMGPESTRSGRSGDVSGAGTGSG